MLTRLAALVLIASLSPPTQAAEDAPGDLAARAQRLCDREHVRLVVSHDMPAEQTARYVLRHDRIDINLASTYWYFPASRERMWRTGMVSTRHPDHLIMHEIAHAKFCRHVGPDRYLAIYQTPLALDPARVSRVVSSYAASDAIEFAAEVYVGRWLGVTYPPDIMAYYESLWRIE